MAQEKGVRPSSTDSSSEGPAGGTDRSQLPQDVEPGWTVKFTFHSAKGLPPADLHPFSSDPYVLAYLKHTNLPKRHIEDPRVPRFP